MHDILISVLRSKQWSANYGLHPSRCYSAVPYRAKGVPAPIAEFRRPDVAVALTCLSYSYAGLSEEQIWRCFGLYLKSDDPDAEYILWTTRCESLPRHLQNYEFINLKVQQQCREVLFPATKYSKKLADFFVAHVVFPREGKESDEKLTTSGWDIVVNKGARFTNGFSVTNDNWNILPLSIHQQDLLDLRHTSAKVLNHVLRKESLKYERACYLSGRQLSAEGLICFLYKLDPNIQILIGVGAQVLDAQTWPWSEPHVSSASRNSPRDK